MGGADVGVGEAVDGVRDVVADVGIGDEVAGICDVVADVGAADAGLS